MGAAQSGGPQLQVGTSDRGALTLTVNDRPLLIDGRVWTSTDWTATGRLLAEVVHLFDGAAAGPLRRTPIHLYHTDVKTVGQTYPETLARRGHTDIYLSARKNYWCQFVYQFAHEYLHYLVGRDYALDDRFGWFEETLGEVAALYALEQLADTPMEAAGLEAFRPHFGTYVGEILDQVANDPAVPLPTLLADYLYALESDRYDRARNREIAVRLLPYFRAEPGLWEAVAGLGQVDGAGCANFPNYVAAWLAVLPAELRSQVEGMDLLL